jgi:hypothetical protein
VRIAYAKSIGVYEVVGADRVVMTQGALDVVEGRPESAQDEKPPASSAPAEDGEDS